jgi:hypothetical protein
VRRRGVEVGVVAGRLLVLLLRRPVLLAQRWATVKRGGMGMRRCRNGGHEEWELCCAGLKRACMHALSEFILCAS